METEEQKAPPKSKGCVHDGGELVAEDAELNPEKAGRVRCATCNCSFLDGELVTRGAECPAFAPEPEGETGNE